MAAVFNAATWSLKASSVAKPPMPSQAPIHFRAPLPALASSAGRQRPLLEPAVDRV